jgi:hypothetical protein
MSISFSHKLHVSHYNKIHAFIGVIMSISTIQYCRDNDHDENSVFPVVNVDLARFQRPALHPHMVSVNWPTPKNDQSRSIEQMRPAMENFK